MDSTGPKEATGTGTTVLRYFYGTFRYFHSTFRYFNLILKGVKETSEPERGAEAHEVRRSAECKKTLNSYSGTKIWFHSSFPYWV